MTPLGAVIGQLALPACVPFAIASAALGMARLEAHLLEPGRRRAAPPDPSPTPEVPDGRTDPVPVPVLVRGPAVDDPRSLDDQRV